MSRLKRAFLVGLGAVSLVLVGSAAHAVVSVRGGTFTDQQRFVHQNEPFTTNAGAFVNVPGAAAAITIPAGTTRMINARYTGESSCLGNNGWCSVRLVVITPSGGSFEMSPVAGYDYAFDSAGTDRYEGHALERTSQHLGAGTYRVQVQAAVVAGATQLRLDDWTLAVGAIRR